MPFSLTHNPIPSYTRPPKEDPHQLFFIRLISICSDFINGAFKFSTAPGRLDVTTVLEAVSKVFDDSILAIFSKSS
jgi:hypothetical protein